VRDQQRSFRSKGASRGIALVLVLWLTVLLTVIAGGFAYTMRNEAMAARNALSLAQARNIADGAIYRTLFELLRPRGSTEVWVANGLVHAWNEDGSRVLANALDESGKIDLNTAAEGLLRGLLQTAGGLDFNAASQVLDAIQDWRDPDDLRRPNGAEAAEYEAAGRHYRPANARFEDVAELQRVLGVTPALFAQIAGSLTVHTNMPGVNPTFASRTVLLAVPGATPEVVDTYLAQRQDALAARQQPPGFPLAMGFGASALNIWRIRAEVATPDGVSFIREAVVKQNPVPKRPMIILLWQEGDRRMLAEPEARPTDEGTSGTRKS
jgi:general secretion pathway protein K